MFKYLFICRHADAAAAVAGQPDFDRPLSRQGEQEALLAAQWVLRSGIPIPAIVCSAARRTRQTAQIFAQVLQVPAADIQIQEALYEASPQELQDHIEGWPASRQAGLVIGHNPAVSQLVGKFNSSPRQYVPTGGVNLFTLEAGDWLEISWCALKWQANF